MTNQFLTAKIKLTAWYVLIIFLISSALSGLYYIRTCQILDFQSYRIQRQLDNKNLFLPPNQVEDKLEFVKAENDYAHLQLTKQIIRINLYILTLSAAASYFLATRTLAPIQKASDKQKQFISNAAHELKTPITALKSSLEVNLMDKKNSKITKKILKDNLVDVNSLQSLTKNLLTLASFDNQRELIKNKTSLKTVINRSLRHLSPLAKLKDITIKKSYPKKFPSVLANSDSLTELFIILLDNAIKYSPNSSAVSLSLSSSKKTVKVLITDQGLGIAPEDLPHIFDRFYRVDQSRTSQKVAGHGLGLSLAHTIVSRHSGKITVNSKPGSGSTFTVTLPKA